MHRPGRITQVGSGSTSPYMLCRSSNGYGLTGIITTGSATWKVETTADDLQRGETATWQDHGTLTASATDDKGNLQFLATAIRLTISSGAGTVQLDIVPSGVAG